MIKIHSGLYRGRKLKSTSNPVIRPITAMVKLSFFDIIQNNIREKIFLDGFAGTGNIGIEALSRGAEYVIFIDELAESCKIIKHNLEKIGIVSDFYRIIKGDFNRSIINLAKQGFKFDIIFLDPPFKFLEYANPLKVICKRKVLSDEGIVVLQRPKNLEIKNKYLQHYRTQKIANKYLDFYENPH